MHDVKAWGIGYAFENPPQGLQCANLTPTGSAGYIFADKTRHGEGRVKMDMEAQTWRKMPRPGQDDIYLGYWKDSPPGPDDVARATQLSGYSLKMQDGRQWLCPLVRFFDKASEQVVSGLPTKMALDASGEVTAGEVVDRYQYLYDAMDQYATAMQADRLIQLLEDQSLSQVCKAARTLLQTNYVIDLPEIEALGLWQLARDECMDAVRIIVAAIDFANYHEWDEASKKKTPSPAAAVG